MDEQGIYCPQCRAYVHFWFLPTGVGRPRAERPAPGAVIEMPQACKQCGYKGPYKTSDLRTRRVPTEPARPAILGVPGRQAATLDVASLPDEDKGSGTK